MTFGVNVPKFPFPDSNVDEIGRMEERCRCGEDGGVCEPCGLHIAVDGVCRDCRLNMHTITAALLRCTFNGHLDCMKGLMAAGADVNGVVENSMCPCGRCPYQFMAPRWAQNYTPLMMTLLEHDDVECVKFLIQKGADVNKVHGHTGCTPLICAAEGGSCECLRFVIAEGADVNHFNNNGYSALWYAVIRGNAKCMEALIKAGADVNGIRDREPIWAAAYNGNAECMETLIKAGADVNKAGTSCGASFRKAHSNNNSLEQSTPLMDTMRFRNAECAEFLIGAGADVNAVDSLGNTPFIFSCYCGVNTAKSLLRAGAKINMVNASGGNAFEEMLQDEHVAQYGIPPDKTMVLFLYASGEILRANTLQRLKKYRKVKKNLKLNLKKLCREAIRKHLLKLDPHSHLFGRVPRLGLPVSLTSYLLYNFTLDVTSKEIHNKPEIDPKQ